MNPAPLIVCINQVYKAVQKTVTSCCVIGGFILNKDKKNNNNTHLSHFPDKQMIGKYIRSRDLRTLPLEMYSGLHLNPLFLYRISEIHDMNYESCLALCLVDDKLRFKKSNWTD